MATQLNFAQQMDVVLKTLGDARPRLLLHACCGPCSSAVLEQLCQYFDITVLYYNPNTWPAEEYYRRGEELKKFVAEAHPLGVTVVEDTYDPQEFYTAVQGLETELTLNLDDLVEQAKVTAEDPELQEARSAIAQLGGAVEDVTDYTIPGTEVTHRVVRIRKERPTPAGFPRAFARIKKAPLR